MPAVRGGPPRRSRIARADALRRLRGWRGQLSAPGVETADSNRAGAEPREAGRAGAFPEPGPVARRPGWARARCWPPLPLPPLLRGGGEGGMYFSPWVTQGGARASLTLGYFLEPRTGFSVGAPCMRGFLAAGWHWRPSLRGVRSASCVGRRSARRIVQTSTCATSLRRARSRSLRAGARGIWRAGARRSGATAERSNMGSSSAAS